MKIKVFEECGGSNSYMLTEGTDAVMIDCAAEADEVASYLKKEGCSLKYILLTHGHFDHICTLDEVREKTGAEVLISEEDAPFLTDSAKNGSRYLIFSDLVSSPADGFLQSRVKAGNIELEVIKTPGHTDGSVVFAAGNIIFSGDTLFDGSIGRTDLFSGNTEKMKNSLSLLLGFDKTALVYPGHGGSTTIGDEILYNPYVKYYNLQKKD